MESINSRLLEDLKTIDTASLCDAKKSLRVASPEIRCMTANPKFAGIARVVSCQDDFLPVLLALKQCNPGEVLVICASGFRLAFAGELFAYEAKRRQMSAIIIDGCCRDSYSISSLTFPVYARYSYPMAGPAQKLTISSENADFGGIEIFNGDWIIGDKDGLVVLSNDELINLIPIAKSIQENERIVLQRINQGESLFDMLNITEHESQLRQEKESKLKFTLD